VAVDHGPEGGDEPAGAQVIQAAFPGLEGLPAGAELERQELLLAIGEDGDDAQDRHAHDPPRTPDSQGEGVEVEAEDVQGGQRTSALSSGN
jgi:hypothetical protein